MEARLTEAAMAGSVVDLLDLLQQDPLLLDKIIVLYVSETPLHVAALMGHTEFAAEILNRRPEMAAELDSDGNSPLHLAAAKGRPDVAKLLLRACPEAGKVRNLDGRTPLHVAAAKGRVEVVDQLVRNAGELTRSLTDRGETAMHLCVRNGKVEALRVIIEVIGKDEELVNWSDTDGNTVLHIAVAKKNLETIKLLLTVPGLNVNLLNKTGSTALDILMQSPRDLKDLEIEESLVSAGALPSKEIDSVTTTSEWRHFNSVKFAENPEPLPAPPLGLPKGSSKRQSLQRPFTVLKGISKKLTPPPPPKQGNWLGRKRSSLMVVASLIATVAFQAAITPPGGVWQDDLTSDENGNPVSNPHKAGTAIMAYNGKDTYGFYMISNTVSFLASLSIILLLVSGLPIQRRRWVWIQMVIMWIAITSLVVTYFISLRNMSILDTKNVDAQFRDVTEISVLTWLCLMLVVFFGNIARMNMWVLRKYGLIKEKERRQHSLVNEEEDDEDEL